MRVIRAALSALIVAGGLGCGSAATEPVKIDRPLPKGRIPAAPRLVPVKNSRAERQTLSRVRYLG
jgi:hypothetical protein